MIGIIPHGARAASEAHPTKINISCETAIENYAKHNFDEKHYQQIRQEFLDRVNIPVKHFDPNMARPQVGSIAEQFEGDDRVDDIFFGPLVVEEEEASDLPISEEHVLEQVKQDLSSKGKGKAKVTSGSAKGNKGKAKAVEQPQGQSGADLSPAGLPGDTVPTMAGAKSLRDTLLETWKEMPQAFYLFDIPWTHTMYSVLHTHACAEDLRAFYMIYNLIKKESERWMKESQEIQQQQQQQP